MGCKICVSHPTTHKYSMSYLPRSVSWNASVKYISLHLGKNEPPSKKQRDISLYVGCAKCGGYLAPSVRFRRVNLILAHRVLCGIFQHVTLLVVAQRVMPLVGEWSLFSVFKKLVLLTAFAFFSLLQNFTKLEINESNVMLIFFIDNVLHFEKRHWNKQFERMINKKIVNGNLKVKQEKMAC